MIDLIGVLLMGIDLIRVQRAQKYEAAMNVNILKEVLENTEFAESDRIFVATGVSGSDGFDWDGGADPWKIAKHFEQTNEVLDNHADGLSALASFLKRAIAEQAKAAARTVTLTYLGLGMVAVGFGLQLAGTLLPSNGAN